jgi:hypothetical protein
MAKHRMAEHTTTTCLVNIISFQRQDNAIILNTGETPNSPVKSTGVFLLRLIRPSNNHFSDKKN